MRSDTPERREQAVVVAETHAPELVEVVRSGSYTDIVKELKRLPEERQINALAQFYAGFPNGERVAGRMYRIINTPWLKSGEIGGYADTLRGAFSEHLERLSGFHTNPSGEWSDAKDAACNAAQIVVDESGRETAYELVDKDAYYIVWDTTISGLHIIHGGVLGVAEEAAKEASKDIVSSTNYATRWDPTRDAIRHAAREAGDRYRDDIAKNREGRPDSSEYWDYVFERQETAAREAALKLARKACWGTEWDASYEVVDDLLDGENPWSPLIDEIYGSGFLINGYEDGTLFVMTRRGIEELKI